jgi:hypothetical protein
MAEQADVLVKKKLKTPEPTGSRGRRRLTLEFNDQSYNLLEALSKEMGNSKKEAIKKALSLLKIAIDEQKQGSILEFANKKKDYRKEVALLF